MIPKTRKTECTNIMVDKYGGNDCFVTLEQHFILFYLFILDRIMGNTIEMILIGMTLVQP